MKRFRRSFSKQPRVTDRDAVGTVDPEVHTTQTFYFLMTKTSKPPQKMRRKMYSYGETRKLFLSGYGQRSDE